MKYLITSLLILTFLSGYGQQYSISGYVHDAMTGEKLLNANVFIENSPKGTATNNFGYYTLQCQSSDTLVITASYIGYKSQSKKVALRDNITINFALKPGTEIDEVTVTGKIPIEKNLEVGMATIPLKQLKRLPVLGGEPDIMKAYQLMPGIQSGNEGSSNLFVRGGSPDQNLVIIDDVPVYYLNHLGGFISVFNSDAINSVEVIKGGFPARYGSRLSSVMDVRMKEGNMKEFQGNFSVGLLNTKLSLEGPLKKDTSSFLFSLRGLPWEYLLRPYQIFYYEDILGYNYYDLNTKVNYKINSKNRLYLSFYKGDDNVVSRENELFVNEKSTVTFRWGNQLGAFRWNHIFSHKLFVNTTLATTRYRNMTEWDYRFPADSSKYYYKYATHINDWMVKADFEYLFRENHRVKFGLNSIIHLFEPGISSNIVAPSGETTTDTTYGFKKFHIPENRLYIENFVEFTDNIRGNIGFHTSLYPVENEVYFSFQPRIILNFGLSNAYAIKTSYAEMQQYTHLLSSSTITFPTDIWVPSTKKVKPSRSQQFSLGLYKTYKEGILEFSLESYYKTSSDLISYKEGYSPQGTSTHWENKIETGGKGKSYGLELLLQKKKGRTTGWIAYTLAKTERQFDRINNGKWYPYKYDRRHDLSIVLNHRLNNKIDLSGSWIYGSGYPYTMPVAQYDPAPSMADFLYSKTRVTIYSDPNAHRMRAYHRFDFSAYFSKKKKKGIRTWTISIYNVYNRKNPYFYFTKEKKGKLHLYQQSLFPVIPSVSYSFRF
jgi:hypothetical protein